MEIISKTLSEVGLSLDSVAAQCYDGASVISGEGGGLQTIFCAACGRYILYVHCYCHRVHLVVTDVFDSLQDVKNHYSILSKLYNLLKILAVKRSYTRKLKRLITTRWSGHFDSVVAFRSNVAEIIEALETCLKKKDIDQISTAIVLLKFIKSSQFIVTNEFVYEILQLLNIALNVLQGRGATLAAANRVIENCKRLLQEKRNTWGRRENFQKN